MPRVSILTGIYQCEATLVEALESILAQTFTDWEMILCDDGSTDRSPEIAQSFVDRDSRFVLIRNPRNLGLAAALNLAFQHAKGEYLARMDGDDRSRPDRLAIQVAYLDAHPSCAVVSGAMASFDEKGFWGTIRPRQQDPSLESLAWSTPFTHAPCMMRREVLARVGGYRTDVGRVEDYDLWVRVYAAGFKGHNLDQVLYEVREDRATNRRRDYRRRVDEARVAWRACRMLGLSWRGHIGALRPLLVGLLPTAIYETLRKRRHA
ncbi:glycosyltransferase family 2 protein [Geothrix paludis]|uniref:glycosyltransferase family 2 protein n=1 Tax=Geothrix paludis TaxID=2922722 RepID=UPI001FADF73F|nr:glycosyltransferase [Geothrix paludis]